MNSAIIKAHQKSSAASNSNTNIHANTILNFYSINNINSGSDSSNRRAHKSGYSDRYMDSNSNNSSSNSIIRPPLRWNSHSNSNRNDNSNSDSSNHPRSDFSTDISRNIGIDIFNSDAKVKMKAYNNSNIVNTNSRDKNSKNRRNNNNNTNNSNIGKIDSNSITNASGNVTIEALSDNLVTESLQLSFNPNEVSTKEIMAILDYSFTPTLNRNFGWLNLICSAYSLINKYIESKPRESISMKNILKVISKEVGLKVFKINRKKEELLSLETAIVLAFMKSKYCENISIDLAQFLVKYPEFAGPNISTEERAKLLEFCNCVRVVQCLIPPNNNKEHILDLVSRLTEGYAVRRVTGTGMTQETRYRYDIIHREGNIEKKRRVDNFVDTEGESDSDDSRTNEGEKVESSSNAGRGFKQNKRLKLENSSVTMENHSEDRLLMLLGAAGGASIAL